MSVPCHKTEILEGRGGFSSPLHPSQDPAPSRGSGKACTTHQGSGIGLGGVSSNPCPTLTSNPRSFKQEEPQGSRKLPEVPSWKREGSHLCPATHRNPVGVFQSASPSFLLPPIPAAHSHLGFGKIKAQSLLQPPPQPNWQLLACCLCPDMAEGHRQLGDGVDFPFGSREEGEGRRPLTSP